MFVQDLKNSVLYQFYVCQTFSFVVPPLPRFLTFLLVVVAESDAWPLGGPLPRVRLGVGHLHWVGELLLLDSISN